MAPETLVNVVESLNLKGKPVPSSMLRTDPTRGSYACDCGACDDGGYCICDDYAPREIRD